MNTKNERIREITPEEAIAYWRNQAKFQSMFRQESEIEIVRLRMALEQIVDASSLAFEPTMSRFKKIGDIARDTLEVK